MTDCLSLFTCALLVLIILIIVRNNKQEKYFENNVPYGLDPAALAAVTGVRERMGNKGGVDQIAMAASLAHMQAGRVNTERNPKLLNLMMDPRYKQYGAGRGGLYHY